jgi:hypothetical protein
MLCWCAEDALLMLCWCSFWGVAVSTHMILPIKAANTSILGTCRSASFGLYMMQHTKLLTLRWCSFSDWDWDHAAISFAYHGCQYVDYGYMPYQSPWITQDAIPKIVNTLLTLCWHSVDTLLMLCWCSVDDMLTMCWHLFWGVAVLTHTMSPIKAANTSIIDQYRSTVVGLYNVQHTESLTLCWRSFSDWGCDHVAISFVYNGCQ